jgi:transposase
MIPSNRSRKIIIPHDEAVYKYRNRIERCFSRMKHCRRFATRYHRRTVRFERLVYLTAATIWLRRMSIRPSAVGS